MKRKHLVVFLDIDGVLNNEKTLVNNGAIDALDPESLKLIEKLVEETGANIVITSTWRLGHSLYWIQHMFRDLGFSYPERIIGATMDLAGEPRGKEIKLWLQQVPVDGFVILDDDGDMPGVQEHLVKTSFKTGLTKKHTERAKKMLIEQLEAS
jgi:hypothetical protein